MEDVQFFDPAGKTTGYRGRLPHLEQRGVCYFVTFMAKDAMPKAAKEAWQRRKRVWLYEHGLSPDLTREEILDALPPEKRRSFDRMLSSAYQKALDGGSGECLLQKPDLRRHVVGALEYHSGRTCQLSDYVVMPNHVHLLLQPFPEHSLREILRSIRKYSAGNIHKDLGRHGSFWAREPFDHMVRSRRYFERYRRYIRANPKRARLREGMYTLGP
jgi:type I restriction enzyme R subunit